MVPREAAWDLLGSERESCDAQYWVGVVYSLAEAT